MNLIEFLSLAMLAFTSVVLASKLATQRTSAAGFKRLGRTHT